MTFMLFPGAVLPLNQLLDAQRAWMQGADLAAPPDQPFVPLAQSLPLLIDLLRGAGDLSAAGIVHGSIRADNVLLHEGRPLLSDFRIACMIQESGIEGGPRRASCPNGRTAVPADDVWQIGLLFAEMCLGFDPVEAAVLQEAPGPDEAGPQLIHDVQDCGASMV